MRPSLPSKDKSVVVLVKQGEVSTGIVEVATASAGVERRGRGHFILFFYFIFSFFLFFFFFFFFLTSQVICGSNKPI